MTELLLAALLLPAARPAAAASTDTFVSAAAGPISNLDPAAMYETRSLAAALSPTLGAALFAAGFLAAPLIACGVLKTAYDLALWRSFSRHNTKG